ncbi:MAG: ROK family protein [Phycisphaerae bacterium]|nr:ROK family protein [Phycisphaerae bacterium]
MAEEFIGIDLGGTNLKLGIVENERVTTRLSVPTEADKGPDHVIGVICNAVRQLCEKASVDLDQVAGIGIGAPGPLDHMQGEIIFAPNLPGWRHIPLRDSMMKDLGRPVVLENDANVAAYAEFRAGAGRGKNSLALFTLGTGIGGGFIIDGKMIRGENDCGAEVGHTIIVYCF